MNNRCHLRGTTLLGIFNTITGCLFNRVLIIEHDAETRQVTRRWWDKATNWSTHKVFPPTKAKKTNAALIDLSPQLITSLLQLPTDIAITGAVFHPLSHLLTIRIDGPTLPRVCEGAMPPIIDLTDLPRDVPEQEEQVDKLEEVDREDGSK